MMFCCCFFVIILLLIVEVVIATEWVGSTFADIVLSYFLIRKITKCYQVEFLGP